MSDNSERKTYRWKGKIVTKKIYEQRIAQQTSGKKRKIEASLKNKEVENQENAEPTCMDGRRIVDLKLLSEQLWCISCKEALSLQYIENEIRRGLGSQLSIRCHKCLILNQVCTSKYDESEDKRRICFDTNYKAVLGALHCGLGWTHLSKLCACLNIPCFDFKTYKKYEARIGQAAENVAKESCADAAALEKKLTLEQKDNITKLL